MLESYAVEVKGITACICFSKDDAKQQSQLIKKVLYSRHCSAWQEREDELFEVIQNIVKIKQLSKG